MNEAIDRLKSSHRVTVLTGAGVSADSGIPTFRGAQGLWREYRPEDLATPDAFARDPKLVWEWYDWRRQLCAQAQPNAAHHVIAAMEDRYSDFLLITQNVDNLHVRAGNRKLVEIHGNITRARCTICPARFTLDDGPLSQTPVLCHQCGELARPDIVWFGETYDQDILHLASHALSHAEVILVVGTSGAVHTPVLMAQQARIQGAYVIDVNPNPSAVTPVAHCSIREKAAVALPAMWRAIDTP